MVVAEQLNAAHGWQDEDWEELLGAIKYKKCTPFLGAGACAGVLPLGGDLAREFADHFDFPFPDRHNLPRVAQYAAVERGPNTPKYRILDRFSNQGPPDFNNPTEPHRLMADLRLPLYITTNYDDFLMRALQRDLPSRQPQRLVCSWYKARRRQAVASSLAPPTPDRPLVFHLHGCLDQIESMVLTEDDYLDFLMALSEVPDLIPSFVEDAFVVNSLLFLGYSLEDINLRVLFRRLATYLQRNEGARHVSVQLAPRPESTDEEQALRARRQQEYLAKQFGLQNVRVYWGTCEQFAAELRKRWEHFTDVR